MELFGTNVPSGSLHSNEVVFQSRTVTAADGAAHFVLRRPLPRRLIVEAIQNGGCAWHGIEPVLTANNGWLTTDLHHFFVLHVIPFRAAVKKTYHIVTRAAKESASIIEQFCQANGQMLLPLVNIIENASQVVGTVIHEIGIQCWKPF